MAKILFVHNHAALAEIFRRIFLGGCLFGIATSYEEGLEKVKEEDYDLIFVQGSFIKEFGDEIVQESSAPVVMVSGGETKFFYALSREVGCKGFVALPRGINTQGAEQTRALIRRLINLS